MNAETLGMWRDIALIFLIVQSFIVTLATGAVFGVAWWYLRKGRKALVMPLLYGQVYALRAQHITLKATDKVAAVPIGANALAARIGTTVRTLVKGRTTAADKTA
jgi:hypothetical protein